MIKRYIVTILYLSIGCLTLHSNGNILIHPKSLLLALTLALATYSASAADRNVLVSIKPLYLAVDEAFGDWIDTQLLLPATVSPHHYSLRPSEALKLRQADLFVWVGPELEQFLTKPLKQNQRDPETIFSALTWLKNNQPQSLLYVNQVRAVHANSINQNHQHLNHHHPNQPQSVARTNKSQTKDKEADHTSRLGVPVDPHFWLSRELIISVIKALQQKLSAMHPELSLPLQNSAQQFIDRLRQQPSNPAITNRQFISYHNGFDYLAQDMGISIIDVLTTNTELKPGAHHLISLKTQVDQGNICLITEPQFRSGITDKLMSDEATNVVEVDPMGGHQQSYSAFLTDIISRLEQCGSSQERP